MAGGRPTKYKDEFLEQAYKFALLGAKDTQLAELFEVNVDTIKEWKEKKEGFSAALKEGKKKADSEVSHSLYHKAKGYEFVEEQAIKVKCGKDQEKIEIVEVLRVVPPDTVACIFWLKNRQPEDWREKQEHQVTGDLNVNLSKDDAEI